MGAKEKQYSDPFRCSHCGVVAAMERVAAYNQCRDIEVEYQPDLIAYEQVGDIYELLCCASCSKVTLRSYYWHSGHMESAGDTELDVLYPVSRSVPAGLPPNIIRAFEAAERVRSIDPNAYAVLVGRMLDLVLTDRGADGGTQNDRLADLAKKGEIPQKLVEVAAGLRRLRNVGAHADLGELGEDDVDVLHDLGRAILEYVYAAPMLVQRAQERLAELKKPRVVKSSP